jgi:hypothetical protein
LDLPGGGEGAPAMAAKPEGGVGGDVGRRLAPSRDCQGSQAGTFGNAVEISEGVEYQGVVTEYWPLPRDFLRAAVFLGVLVDNVGVIRCNDGKHNQPGTRKRSPPCSA